MVGRPGSGRERPIVIRTRTLVNPAATGGKISVLPWEVSMGLGTIPSRSAATRSDARGGVSRGHGRRPGRAAKGRIRKLRSSLDRLDEAWSGSKAGTIRVTSSARRS